MRAATLADSSESGSPRLRGHRRAISRTQTDVGLCSIGEFGQEDKDNENNENISRYKILQDGNTMCRSWQ